MRRLATFAALALAAAAGLAAVVVPGAGGSSSYRVDVVFDNSRGLTRGQLVEVAGARVGRIEAIHLTPGYKARLELSVDSRFAPFRTNASCTIRPQGLLAEYYVECDPGSPSAPPLRGSGSRAPTVPVTRTTQPVALTDLFSIWKAPVRDRLTLLISQLGLGTAGRGEQLNDMLRRSNPSLAAARRLIGVLRRQRDQLASLIDSTGNALGPLAARPERVGAFVREAERTTRQTSAHSRELAEAVRRLPALLDAAEPSLHELDAVIRTGTPLAKRLHEAAPTLDRLTRDLGPFASEVRPTLRALGPVLTKGAVTLRRSIPISRAMRDYTHNSRPSAELVGPLFTNLQKQGFTESLLLFMYRGAAAAARFDATSHILPAYSLFNQCSQYANAPVAGCTTKPTSAAKARGHKRARRHRPAGSRRSPGADTPAPAPKRNAGEPVKKLVDQVLQLVAPPQPVPPAQNEVEGLLDYLTK